MASERSTSRFLRRALLALALLLAVVVATGAWLLGTASGARSAFSALEALTRHAVRANGVDGRLAGSLRIATLTLAQGGGRIELRGILLDWRPAAMLRGLLHIERLHVDRAEIEAGQEQAPKPPALPESLALPIHLAADDVRLGSGALRRGQQTLATFGPLALQLAFDGDRYRLQLQRLSAAAGALALDGAGEATLGASKPYPIAARLSSAGTARIEEHALAANGSVNLDGSLQRMDAAVDLKLGDAGVAGRATLSPFSAVPLGAAQLRVEALDLARFDPRLPATRIALQLTAAEDGGGQLRLNNTLAGAYDGGKLPLASLAVAFRQRQGEFLFDRIAATLGSAAKPAGDATGSGHLQNGALSLLLRTGELDLKRIDGRMRATRLAGEIELHHAGGRQTFRADLSEPFGKQRVTLSVQGERSATEIAVHRAVLQAGGGRAEFSGRFAPGDGQAFDAEGSIAHFRLRELGRFPEVPDFELNGNFSLHGRRQPQLEADLAFRIDDSSLAGQPLAGDGTVALRGERLSVPRLTVVSGVNRLNAEGELSDGSAQLAFTLDARQLGQFGPAFGGSLQANGTVRGTLAKPHVVASWNAANARLPGGVQIDRMQGDADLALDRGLPHLLEAGNANVTAGGLRRGAETLASVAASLRFSPLPDAPLALTLRAEGIAVARLQARRFDVSASGSTAKHDIDIALEEAGQSWTLNAAGGLDMRSTEPRWQGTLEAFDARGRLNARLASKARLLLSAAQFQLDDLQLQAEGARLTVDRFARGAAGIETRGRVDSLELAALLRLAATPPPVRTDLELSGDWDLRIADALSGKLELRRERGDVTVLAGAPVALGLNTLAMQVKAESGRVALQLQAQGRQLGTIAMNAAGTVGDVENRLAIAPDAPVSGSIRVDIPSLAWAAPLASPSLSADGSVHADIRLAGNFGQPQFSGRVTGNDLRVALADIGLDLRQGTLDSEFQGESLLVRNLAFAGNEGRVSLSGPVDLGGGTVAARLALQAERFALLNRPDRRIVASGSSTLDWRGGSGKLAGAFTINSGFIDLGRADKPELSSDVVVVGQNKKKQSASALAMDVTITTGEGVALKGRGLDGRLEGQVRLASEPGEPLQATGTLNIAKGTYTAYGRELKIEQGLLRFRGPLNNPSLDILAMRRGQEVEAGVSIGGTVLTPRVTLVSEPNVPDAEKLSWLVLGRGLSTAGETDLGALQGAAAALLSEGAKAGVQSRIASAFGLDTFSIGTSQDTLQQRVVTLGKQISSRLYLSYQQGLETAGSVVQLRYALSSKLSLEAEAGSRSALSLFYNIAFD